MRRHDIQSEREADLLAHLSVPEGREVRVVTVEDGQEAQEGSIAEVEVDDQHYEGDVDELHDGNLLELAVGFVVDCQVFLDEDDFLEDEAGNDVDDNDHQG